MKKKFKAYLPEIPVVSLYEIIADWGVDSSIEDAPAQAYSVFDPCAARHETGMKAAVRKIAKDAGYTLEPLPENDAYARCCSYGGQPAIANPAYAAFVTQKNF